MAGLGRKQTSARSRKNFPTPHIYVPIWFMEQSEDSPEATPNLPALGIRRDGWTVERQEAFLKALAACGCVRDACQAVGMSHVSAYHLRARPNAQAFRLAWNAALDCSMHRLEEAALSRAIHGVPRPIFYKGEQVGE